MHVDDNDQNTDAPDSSLAVFDEIFRRMEEDGKAARIGHLVTELRRQLRLNATAFASELGVTPQTVRRWETEAWLPRQTNVEDIRKLITRAHAGAANVTSISASGYTARQVGRNEPEKKAIAKYVAREILDNYRSAFLDAGSTSLLIGSELLDQMPPDKGFKLLTNNILLLDRFRAIHPDKDSARLILTGGVYNASHDALFGVAAETMFTLNAQAIVVGASGFAVHGGNYSNEGAYLYELDSEPETKKAIIAATTQIRFVVCDHTKLGVYDGPCFASLAQLAAGTEACTVVTSAIPQGRSAELAKFRARLDSVRDALVDFNEMTTNKAYYPKGTEPLTPGKYNGVRINLVCVDPNGEAVFELFKVTSGVS